MLNQLLRDILAKFINRIRKKHLQRNPVPVFGRPACNFCKNERRHKHTLGTFLSTNFKAAISEASNQWVININIILKCDALRDLVPFVQFKKREKHPWKSVNYLLVIKLHIVYGMATSQAITILTSSFGFIFNLIDELQFLTHLFPMFPFYTPLKTSENQRFSDVFRGYKKGTLGRNGLMNLVNLFHNSIPCSEKDRVNIHTFGISSWQFQHGSTP